MTAIAKRGIDGEIIERKVDGWVKPPLCVFCSAPWTDDMLKVSAEAALEYGYYGDASVEHIDTTIDIVCSSCKRLVYRKEIRIPNRGW